MRRLVESFGMGWGPTEALILFGIQAPIVTGLRTVSLGDLLAGSLERNAAIILHLTLTFLTGYGIVPEICGSWLKQYLFIQQLTYLLGS